MKEPFALKTPYDYFNVSTDATPSEIKQAYYRFVENNPGKEIEATLMWDKLWKLEKRLVLDIFHYQVSVEIAPKDDFAFELPQIESEDINQLEQRLMNEISERGKKIDFGAAKPIRDLDLEQQA
jgi:hypothetical protein